jgi:ferrous iron transport protein A
MNSSLDTLPPGGAGTITELDAGDEAVRRLMELGLLPGERVEVIGRAPLGDPLAILVRGTRLAVRARDARRIQIAPAPLE